MAPPAASATARASRRARSRTRARRSRTRARRPRTRARTLAARLRLQSLSRRLIAALAIAGALAAAYTLWLRDSSLVAVERIEVTGLTTSAAEIGGALESAALEMTTLNVDVEALEAAVARYPTVESLSVETDFPHGLTITVEERAPVAVVYDRGDPVAVDGSGRMLPGVKASELPPLEAEAPESGRLEGPARAQAIVLGAAPEPLRALIEEAVASEGGVDVIMRGGVELQFGDPDEAAAKWRAAAAVLADPELDAVTYIDLRVPDRPAVGGSADFAEAQP
jgi:cell division protein FtsQ